VIRVFAVLILAFGVMACGRIEPRPLNAPSHLRLAPQIRFQLHVLSVGLVREIQVCIQGFVVADTAYATGLYIPDLHLSDVGRSVAAACGPDSVAKYHNHPRAAIQAVQGDSLTFQRAGCYLSGTDIRTSKLFPVAFTMVGSGKLLCYWTFADLLGADDAWALPVHTGNVLRWARPDSSTG
jgi:hypothetical protein